MINSQYKYLCFLNFKLINEIYRESNIELVKYGERYIEQMIMSLSLKIDEKENNYDSTADYQS